MFSISYVQPGAHFRDNFYFHPNHIQWKIDFSIRVHRRESSCYKILDMPESAAVMLCAKFHNNLLTATCMRKEWNIHRFRITMKQSLMKRAHGPLRKQHCFSEWLPAPQWSEGRMYMVTWRLRGGGWGWGYLEREWVYWSKHCSGHISHMLQNTHTTSSIEMPIQYK